MVACSLINGPIPLYSTGIVYIDEADKLARRGSGGDNMQRDVGGEGVQQSLLRMMEGSMVTVNATKGNDNPSGIPSTGYGRRGREPSIRKPTLTINILQLLSAYPT